MKPAIDVFLTGACYRKYVGTVLRPIMKKYQLSHLDIEILFYLMDATEENNKLRDIVAFEGFNKGQVSLAITKMVERDLLSRRFDEADNRLQHLDLLEKARPIIEEIRQLYDVITETVYHDISEVEILAFRRTAAKIVHNIRQKSGKREGC